MIARSETAAQRIADYEDRMLEFRGYVQTAPGARPDGSG